jgi:ubiquinone/menaquinone biosynthesis C-methylase UbiE
LADDGLAHLKTLHPDPEPPRRSRMVDFWVWVDEHRPKAQQYYSPHSCGGTLTARAEYEYNNVDGFTYILKEIGLDIDLFDGKRVLDAGCGWGGKMVYFSEHSKAISFDGFDIAGYKPEVSEEFAKQHNVTNCHFTNGYAESMPYEDGRFDLVMMDDVMEHVQDPEKTLRECWRVLRPGGELLMRFPSFRMMEAHHLNRGVGLPAMHYVLPMKTWSAGLNYRLLQAGNTKTYVPFARTIKTKYHPAINFDLNGIDFKSFKALIHEIGFQPRVITMLPYISDMKNARRKWLRAIYLTLYRIPAMQEFLSHTIAFYGTKPA